MKKDKRFAGTVKLPNLTRPKLRIGMICDAAHVEEAKKVEGLEMKDREGLLAFNKDPKEIKKWAKKYHILLCTDSIMGELNKILGNILPKIGKMPISIPHSEPLAKKVEEVKQSVKYQLKKDINLGVAVGNVNLTEEQLRQNITMALNFLASLLKKGWQNMKTVHIKSSMGHPHQVFG